MPRNYILTSSRASIVKKGCTNAFITKMNAAVPSKAFWDDCARTRKSITKENIERMDSIIRGEIDG